MNFKEACDELWRKANYGLLAHDFRISIDDENDFYDLLIYSYSLGFDQDFVITLEKAAYGIELSYGFKYVTYHTAVIFTDQPLVFNACEDCGMCHSPGDICRVPPTIVVCTPENLEDKIEDQVNKILEIIEDESEHLRIGAIWAVLENVAREASAQHSLGRRIMQLEAKNHFRLELGTKEQGIVIDAFGDEFGWRFDSHKIENGERKRFETHRFLGKSPLPTGTFNCSCCDTRPGQANFANEVNMVDELVSTIAFYEGV